MKVPSLSALRLTLVHGALALLASTGLQVSAAAQPPTFEATFNNVTDIDLQSGATLGEGVSGQPGDKSYFGDSSKIVAEQKGPHALSVGSSPLQAMEEFTITVWFKSLHGLHNDATLLDAFGTVLIWEEKTSQWVLRVDTKAAGDPKPSSYWFRSGDAAPLGSWANPDEWTFLAVVWKRSDKKATFYQGSKSSRPNAGKESNRPENVEPLNERATAVRTFGNNGGKAKDRTFDGNIDDCRFYSKALDDADIENIRQADLQNKAPALP